MGGRASQPPPRPRPGGGPGAHAPVQRGPQACTHFAGPGDRRAVDAQATHAAGGRSGGQVAVATAARPGDDDAAARERFPSCSTRESPLSGPMGGAGRGGAGARPGLCYPAPRAAGPFPSPSGPRALGPQSHAGPPALALLSSGFTCEAAEAPGGWKGREGRGEGLAKAASAASPRFSAPTNHPRATTAQCSAAQLAPGFKF